MVAEEDVADLLGLRAVVMVDDGEEVIDLALRPVAGELSLHGVVSGARLATLTELVTDLVYLFTDRCQCNVHVFQSG